MKQITYVKKKKDCFQQFHKQYFKDSKHFKELKGKIIILLRKKKKGMI